MTIDLTELCAGGPVLTDGAMGTQLDKMGLPPGTAHELWNIENPKAVGKIHAAYAQAGSRVVLTNTFQANPIVLAKHGLEKKTADLNKAGVELAAEAVGGEVLVFGSVGPSGELLMTGEVGEDDLLRAFGRQIAALGRAGAAGIVVESFADVAEAAAALKAARDNCDLPVVVSFSFGAGENKDRTVMGADAASIVKELDPLAPAALGANCGVGPDTAKRLVENYRGLWNEPIWIKPNAGLPQLVGGKTVFSAGPEEFAEQIPALVEAGAGFVGGCCGTTPEHIRAVAEILKDGQRDKVNNNSN